MVLFQTTFRSKMDNITIYIFKQDALISADFHRNADFWSNLYKFWKLGTGHWERENTKCKHHLYQRTEEHNHFLLQFINWSSLHMCELLPKRMLKLLKTTSILPESMSILLSINLLGPQNLQKWRQKHSRMIAKCQNIVC